MGICGTDRVERQEGKGTEGTNESNVEVTENEGQVGSEREENPKWPDPTRRSERTRELEGRER